MSVLTQQIPKISDKVTKMKPLLAIVTLLVAFVCVVRATVGWIPGESIMIKNLQQSSLSTHTAIAANPKATNPEAVSSQTVAVPELTVNEATPDPLTTTDQTKAHSQTQPCAPGDTSRLSSTGSVSSNAISDVATLLPTNTYHPREEVRLAHPSNYGERFRTDIYGRPASPDYIAVLHETVYSADSAINYFQTPHRKDEDQASYHTLIKRDGTILYVVPPEKRAFGAGNSVFVGLNGPESFRSKRELPPSVNNFAYHVSLESPADGRNENRFHSGYTEAQYQSLAWLLARTSIPEYRITTHRQVDRSGTRQDPRSFDANKFLPKLRAYSRRVLVGGVQQCVGPAVTSQTADATQATQTPGSTP